MRCGWRPRTCRSTCRSRGFAPRAGSPDAFSSSTSIVFEPERGPLRPLRPLLGFCPFTPSRALSPAPFPLSHLALPASHRHGRPSSIQGIAHAQNHIRLTLPHGDRERQGLLQRECTKNFNSLPLMGIGNGPGRPGGGAAWKCSLPLMGIGNTTRCRGDRKTDQISLPLMGIGNLMRRAVGAVHASPHYPSWGSGTSLASCAVCAVTLAHYPSWGSGTGRRRPKTGRTTVTHYPSWGSGTRSARRALAGE